LIIPLALSITGVTQLIHTTSVWASSRRAERIVKKHINAIGGKSLKAINSVRVLGRVEVRDLEVSFTLWKQRPDLSRLEVSILGYDVIQAYDGETAWWVNPVLGAAKAEEMPADFARELIRWSDFDGPLVDYKKKRHKIKLVDEETLDTGSAYKLRIALHSGDEIYSYIDAVTYMEVKRTHTQTYQDKAITVDTYFSDFIEIDGVTTARVIRGIGFGTEPFIMRLETIDTDVEPDEARFGMPGRHKKRRIGIGY
jgi:hypothetical protein